MFSSILGKKLDKFHLLKHPFYQVYWNEGKLTREIIKDYAEQYYQHVKAFPRYISATHSICEDIEKRRILLENLQDEENKDGDHPKLWKNFAKALGADEKEIEKVKLDWFTKDMIDNFFSQARKSYAEGLASLYTYERQIPEIAETKIQGLKKFYGVSSKEGLEFFALRIRVDVSPGALEKANAFPGCLVGLLGRDVNQALVDVSLVAFLDRELMDLVILGIGQSTLDSQGCFEPLDL